MTSSACPIPDLSISSDYLAAMDAALASRLRIERYAAIGTTTAVGALLTIHSDAPEAEYVLRMFASGNHLAVREAIHIYDTHTIRVLHAEMSNGAGVVAVQFSSEELHSPSADEPKRVVDVE